jgi:hypothetical protein
MPYKLSESGTTVLVKKKGRFVTLKRHKTKAKARAHLAALNKNVRHK